MQLAKNPMKLLFRYLSNYRLHLNSSIAASVANKVADLMPPLLVGWIIDTASGNSPAWISSYFGISDLQGTAVFLALLIIIIFGIESLFEWLFQYGFLTLAQRVQHDLRLDAYEHLQNREIAYFENERTGNILSILNDDINQLERFLNNSFNEIVQLITLFIFASISLSMVSWELTLIGIVPIPLILLGSIFFQRKIGPYYQKVRETVGQLNSRLENNISGILVIKSFTAEKFETERVREVSNRYKTANKKAIRISALYVPLIRMLIAFGFAAVMYLACTWLIEDTGKITLGELTFFGMMIQRVLWPVTRLGRIFDEFERAKASARRVFGLMGEPNQLAQIEQPIIPENIKGALNFEEVHFSYPNGLPVLKGISLDIQPGQLIGVAGTTGSGKTTLIKLMLRLYDANRGKISLDQTPLQNFDIKALRKQISLVSQDVYLFHGSIRENIAYGNDEISDADIIAAAKQADLHDFIQSLPDNYLSMVGEKGIKLSGGQRQRLSIARAILKNAPILILDEATSSVDTETEREIQQNLKQLIQNRTAIIIAHRLSTIRNADKIIVLKEGKIHEEGSHEELIKTNGVYADLWRIQTGTLSI